MESSLVILFEMLLIEFLGCIWASSAEEEPKLWNQGAAVGVLGRGNPATLVLMRWFGGESSNSAGVYHSLNRSSLAGIVSESTVGSDMKVRVGSECWMGGVYDMNDDGLNYG